MLSSFSSSPMTGIGFGVRCSSRVSGGWGVGAGASRFATCSATARASSWSGSGDGGGNGSGTGGRLATRSASRAPSRPGPGQARVRAPARLRARRSPAGCRAPARRSRGRGRATRCDPARSGSRPGDGPSAPALRAQPRGRPRRFPLSRPGSVQSDAAAWRPYRQLRAQAEGRVLVGDQDERVGDDAVAPADDALDEVEQAPRVAAGEQDREPRRSRRDTKAAMPRKTARCSAGSPGTT